MVAEGSGYNPVVTGADACLGRLKKNFQEAFPGDALKNLWPWPAEPSWYAEIRSQYVQQVQGCLIAGLLDWNGCGQPRFAGAGFFCHFLLGST
jgi:hypothetical protein